MRIMEHARECGHVQMRKGNHDLTIYIEEGVC